MNRTLLRAFSLLALASGVACAQHTGAQAAQRQQNQSPARSKGTIFKHEVDQLIHAIAASSDRPGTAAPYTDSLLANARMLCALGHCHRFYVAIDNPRIKATIHMLIGARQADGSFAAARTGDGGSDGEAAEAALATAWVADALAVMDRERYADEVKTARGWLRRHDLQVPAWDAAVAGVLQRVRADVFPQHLGAEAAARVRTLAAAEDLDAEDAVAVLVDLVACQAANRQLDKQLDGQQDPEGRPAAAEWTPVQQRAFAFLMGQQKDGVFEVEHGGRKFPDPAITGFGLLALQTKPRALRTDAEQTVIEKGLRWLLGVQNEDGSYGEQVQNYTTSVVVGALARWGDPAAEAALQKAQKYVLMCQHAEQDGYQRSDRDYGSIGYGGSQRGDLSNLNFALQALRESGLPAQHEAFQKALVFLQRTQNLKAVNDFSGKVTDPDEEGRLIDVTSGDDGGAAYYPGNSAAGYIVNPDGKSVPRSYGSMTYALLKSYTLCGIGGDDPRVQAAVRWIQDNWTLAENPGFDPALGEKARFQGLFYYYMVLAQALDMAGVDTVTRTKDDGTTEPIDWRQALRGKLADLQLESGAWRNDGSQRWMEGFDVLCACYALVALERCQ